MGDTIYAVSSGVGRAAVAVMRVSGPAAGLAIDAVAGGRPPPRTAALRRLRHPETADTIDRALVLWFPGPASATGEDVAEFHIHGGRAVVAALAEALGSLRGLRPAEPGEFTRRAFDAGKLDLTEAEGVADLVAAETAAQRRQALRQMDGALGRLYDGWRDRLIRILAHLEADLDFPDEDLPDGVAPAMLADAAETRAAIAAHLADDGRGERLRAGVSIAILGPPNVGKSSLLNRLARRDAAIVAATAGTTRDVIEVHFELDGYPAVLWDTAGLREAADDIEAIGVDRARSRAKAADLKLVVVDGTAWPALDDQVTGLIDDRSVVAVNKADVAVLPEELTVLGHSCLPVSAVTGVGIEALMAALAGRVADAVGGGDSVMLTRARHRHALEEVHAARARAADGTAAELVAEDVRLAVRALGRITGRVDVEDLLDVIFRDFCIGK